MQGNQLWVVMPVYNEEASVGRVLDEWVTVLRQTVGSFTVFAVNDGSKDRTAQQLEDYRKQCPELEILHKPNTGHGQSCVEGYRRAVEGGAEWILQIDSDGQCNAEYFAKFWQARDTFPVVFGYRKKREDGFARWLISRFVSVFTWAATGYWLRDANVPYRLMRRDYLQRALPLIPPTMYLANILLSVLLKRGSDILWVPIVFRERIGGSPSLKAFSFVKHGYRLFIQLKEAMRQAQWNEPIGKA